MSHRKTFAEACVYAVMLFGAHAVSAHPVAATSAEIHEYDSKVDDMSSAGQARNGVRLREVLATLQAMDSRRLTPWERDDREMLMGRIKGTLLDDDEAVQYWRNFNWGMTPCSV